MLELGGRAAQSVKALLPSFNMFKHAPSNLVASTVYKETGKKAFYTFHLTALSTCTHF